MAACKDLLPDEELAALVAQGDEASFAVLIERSLPMLLHEASRVRCNLADRDDLSQEALLGLLSAAKAYRSDAGASFATFSRVCVRRRLLNAARVLKKAEMPQEDICLYDEIEKESSSFPSDPDEWLQNKEEEEALLVRLKQLLTEQEYRVLILYLAAYSYSEIARSLDISAKAVDNTLQRVRRKLARML